MPELPEVEILCRRLDERTRGRVISRVEMASISALKTYDPPPSALKGATVLTVERRGKYVCLSAGSPAESGRVWLVIHLARAGWVKWRDKLTKNAGRPGRGPLAMRVGFEAGSAKADADAETGTAEAGFEVTEMGHEKRLAVFIVRDPSEVEGIATLGPEPFDLTTERLGALLAAEKGDLKHALSRQSLIAGVGNAYSDEALHAARLSPFKPAAKLSDRELDELHGALLAVLAEAIERSCGLDLDELKDGKRQGMRVHGRAGLPCPVCGDTIREVAFTTRSLQYCPGCQTGGKPLADRRLSKLLK